MTNRGQVLRAEDKQRATEFVKDLYATGGIDEMHFEVGIARVLGATTDAELVEVVRSLPPPVTYTPAGRRLTRPLEIHSGLGRLRLAGRWQLAAETHVSADLGSVRLDLTEADYDADVIDLHVYSGCGTITIIVPRGVDLQIIRHRGGVSSQLEPPVPGFPLVRLDVTTNIGRVRLRHPEARDRARRSRRAG